jgi:hypothetical protein
MDIVANYATSKQAVGAFICHKSGKGKDQQMMTRALAGG